VNWKAVLPIHQVLQFRAIPATAAEQDKLPFPEMLKGALAENEALVGVTWTRLDGETEQMAPEHQLLPRRGPATVL